MTPLQMIVRFIIAFIMLSSNQATAQTNHMSLQENKLASIYSKLVSFIQADYDSAGFYSARFEKEFTSFIKSNPKTLSYPFQKLIDSNFCAIQTSNDGNFRLYSWDTWTGGTMHIIKEMFQWQDKGQVYTQIPNYGEGDAGSFCSKIFTVSINSKPHYLVIGNGIFSTKDAMQSISVYTINNNKLVDTVKLFKTKTKKLSSIYVEFDFFSVVDRPERPLELITYDEQKKIIYVPVVGNKGQVTNKNILYQLKGSYFEFIGIETGKRK